MPISIQPFFSPSALTDSASFSPAKKQPGPVLSASDHEVEAEFEAADHALSVAGKKYLPDDSEQDFISEEGRQELCILERRYELAVENRQKHAMARILEMSIEDMTDAMSGSEEVRSRLFIDMKLALYTEINNDLALSARQSIVNFVRNQPVSILSNLFGQGSINLADLDLSDINFANTNLRCANFNRANLRGAKFDGADLSCATFHYSNLTHVHFHNSSLRSVKFIGTDLSHAGFKKVDFDSVEFYKAILQAVDFRNEKLWRLKFYASDLRWVDMTGTQIEFAYFLQVDCRGAKFADCNLHGTDFNDVDFRVASFRGCHHFRAVHFFGSNLRGVDFRDSDIHWVNLGGFDLSGSNFAGVYLDPYNLNRANLYKANLSGTGLSWRNLDTAIWKESDLSDLRFSKNPRPSGAFLNFGEFARSKSQSQVKKNGQEATNTHQIELTKSSNAKPVRPTIPSKIPARSNLNQQKKSSSTETALQHQTGKSIWGWFSSLPGKFVGFIKSISLGIWRSS